MSRWTYIRGMVTVSPMGRTQPEKRYILETALAHLPRVTGSEMDMTVHVIQRSGYDMSSGCDEFGMRTDKLISWDGTRCRHGRQQLQTEYFLVLEADLRDREFTETKKEFVKWLTRLAKRVYVSDVLAEISDDWEKTWVLRDGEKLGKMFETPSWAMTEKEFSDPSYMGPNWCEFMMWDYGHDSNMPMLLMHKYITDERNDAEVAHRRNNGGLHWSRQKEWRTENET